MQGRTGTLLLGWRYGSARAHREWPNRSWVWLLRKPNFNAIVIGDMVFQLINPFVKEESVNN